MIPVCRLEWDDGVLRSFGEGLPAFTWTRPADLAAARLALVDAPGGLRIENGKDLLAAAFRIVPFLRRESLQSGGGTSVFSFGEDVTDAARKAFLEFAAGPDGADDFKVLRGEPDDFLMFFRRIGKMLTVGAIAVASGSLTVRLEDAWLSTSPAARALNYRAEAWHDDMAQSSRQTSDRASRNMIHEILEDVAPDARIFLDIAAAGGFLIAFTPAPEN